MATSTQRTAPSSLHLGLTLGLLSVMGPLSIDLYLPAFPTMVRDLAATPAQVQRTLSVFFLALAAAQIPIGSFGDRFGRKLTLYLGLLLYILASAACAAAPTVQSLVWLRFLQGFGICAGTAVSRAMIRDLRQGPEAARLMAMTFLVIGISPVLAPLIGSYLLQLMPWRGLFLVLAAAGAGGLAIARFALPESLPPERRTARRAPILPAYLGLLRNVRFLSGALVAGLATTIPYAYLTAAPFVFAQGFGLTPRQYSLLLALNAVCSIATTQLSPVLMKRWGARLLILRMTVAGVVLIAAMAGLAATGKADLAMFEIFSVLLFGIAGLILTPAAITALDEGVAGHRAGAGAVAGALGALQLAVTACASGAITVFPAFSLLPLLGVMGFSLSVAAIVTLALRRGAAALDKRSP